MTIPNGVTTIGNYAFTICNSLTDVYYGSADTFAPDKVCSRGHIVTFLYRAYNS